MSDVTKLLPKLLLYNRYRRLNILSPASKIWYSFIESYKIKIDYRFLFNLKLYERNFIWSSRFISGFNGRKKCQSFGDIICIKIVKYCDGIPLWFIWQMRVRYQDVVSAIGIRQYAAEFIVCQ